jgi:hypothetical protein
MRSYPQSMKQMNMNQMNWLPLNLPVFSPDLISDSLSVQRKLLCSVIELAYAPLLATEVQTQPLKVDPLTAKLVDPALSFTKAVETAEPLFDILNDEEL